VDIVRSPQTLSEDERRLVASWAADCAERVLDVFEAAAPGDDRPRRAIERTRGFASGDLDTATQIRRRFDGAVPADEIQSPAAKAAARAAGQALGVCHMGAHALGAAGYAVIAASVDASNRLTATHDEIQWQLAHMTSQVRDALRKLPPVGDDRSGPLGPGLLSSGHVGEIIHELQVAIFLDERT
jgi:hypothetical protein